MKPLMKQLSDGAGLWIGSFELLETSGESLKFLEMDMERLGFLEMSVESLMFLKLKIGSLEFLEMEVETFCKSGLGAWSFWKQEVRA